MYHSKTDTDNSEKLPLPQDAWLLFQFDNHEVIRLDLKPGEGIDAHANPWRILFYVLQGEGSLTIHKEQTILKTNQSIAVKANVVRSWLNTGNQVLKLLVDVTAQI